MQRHVANKKAVEKRQPFFVEIEIVFEIINSY